MTEIYLLDNNYPDPTIAYYLSYMCEVCEAPKALDQRIQGLSAEEEEPSDEEEE